MATMATGQPAGPPSIRRFFPGGNTGEGFFSYYEDLWQPLGVPEMHRIWMIKGGPGVGKSTFMARIAQEVSQRGFAVEYHHCSADPDSLDGVVFPQLGVAMLDATAPHVLDPRHPGAVDDLIHLGEFWNEEGIRRHKQDIVALTREYKGCYASAYRYLAAALQLHDEWRAASADAVDWGAVNALIWRLIREATSGAAPAGGPVGGAEGGLAGGATGELAGGATGGLAGATGGLEGTAVTRPGRRRRLFASAITPKGFRHHLPSVAGSLPRRIILTGDVGTGKSYVVARLAQALQEHGYDVEVFHCALRPREPEHLAVPQLGWAVITSEAPHLWEDAPEGEEPRDGQAAPDRQAAPDGQAPGSGQQAAGHLGPEGGGGPPVSQEVIEFDRWRRPLTPLEERRASEARETFWMLMERGMGWLAQAKALHDQLEGYYIPYMDFDGMEQRRQELLTRILEARVSR